MTQNEKFQIQRRNTLRNLWQKLSGTPDFPVKLVLAALYLMGAAYVCIKQAAWRTLAGNIPLLSPLLKAAMEHALLAYLLAGAAVLLVLLLYPFGRRAAKDQLQCIGLINHAGMPPDLLRKHRDKDNPRVTVWEFRNQGIPLQEWEKKRPAIETALGLIIVKLAYAKGKSRVLVYAVPAGDDLPEVLKWEDSYLSSKSFVLVLGESYTGPVTVNLAHIPHILLGGSTGSGKSVLLKLLLMQALHKDAEVYIADFKGGVDYPKVWHEKCRMCFTEEDLLYTLNQLVAVLEYRKKALKELGSPNIDAYNETTENKLPRLIFACDEVAEVLSGEGGDHIATMRRAGDVWYVGGLAGWDGRTVRVDLSLLPEGTYAVELFRDGENAARIAQDYVREEFLLAPGKSFDVMMFPGGGFAARITRR